LLYSCENNRKQTESGDRKNAFESTSDYNSGSGIHITANGFLYHRFNESKYPSTNISASLFENHLGFLVKNNITVITLRDLFQLKDSADITKRYAVITIDDAFDSFYQFGYPLLKKYGLKATLFVNTETIGSGDYLNWDQLKDLKNYGIEIGNHSHSHAYFMNESPADRATKFINDVTLAQNLIKENMDYTCQVFAYPYGEYDAEMQKVIMDLGFLGAAAQYSGVISKYSDPFALPRFPMTETYGQMPAFIEKAKMNPLPVLEIIPDKTVSDKNPPELKIFFINPGFDLERLQCFIQGSEPKVNFGNGDSIWVEIAALKRLENRRHLYTLTVPLQKTNEWYWFSHQWIFPGQP
jgi:peptidoglycan/xylan/chitin deacetylase (PgdA/CDA1 family)